MKLNFNKIISYYIYINDYPFETKNEKAKEKIEMKFLEKNRKSKRVGNFSGKIQCYKKRRLLEMD